MTSVTQKHVVRSLFQLVMFLISCLALAFIFYKPFVMFYSEDKLPALKPYPKIATGRPTVSLGLTIHNFSAFNIETGEFEFNGLVWFQYNPTEIPLEKIKKFFLINGEIKSISEPDVRKVGKKEIAQFEILASFNNNLNYATFPLDDHYVTVGIFNYELPDGTILKSEPIDFNLGKKLTLPGWTILDRSLSVGFVDRIFGRKDLHKTEEVRAFYTLKCKRSNPVSLITILLSILIIIMLSLLPFSLQPYSGDLISGSIGGIVALRFVLLEMSPRHIGYFMVSDYLFIFALCAVIMAITGCIISRQYNLSTRMQSIAVAGIYGIFVLASWISIFLV